MTDYIIKPEPVAPLTAPTVWRRIYPLLIVEIALAWCALGWMIVGLATGIAHSVSPAGNAFVAASRFTGSWVVLTTMLGLTAGTSIIGLILQNQRLRRLGLGLSAFCWGFIAAGLSQRGYISTAVVVYPALSVLAIGTYLMVPGDDYVP